MNPEQESANIQRLTHYIRSLAQCGLAKELARPGFLLHGRGALVIDLYQGGINYLSRQILSDKLEGDRRDICLQVVDAYDPLHQCVVVGILPIVEEGFTHFHIVTTVV